MKKPFIIMGIAAVSAVIIWAYFLMFASKKEEAPEVRLPKEEPRAVPVEKNTVSIKSFAFEPETLVVKVGETVTWLNEDGAVHTVKSADFVSPNIKNRETFKFQFTKTGTFEYTCGIHPYMKGKVIVE